jgi:GAF domain-containing protein
LLVPKAVSAEMADVGYERSTVEEGGIAGEAYRNGESIVTDDVRDSTLAEPATDEYRAILTVPMGDVGVFQAGSRTPGAFDDDDRELAELLLAHAEQALRRIRFETALRERNRTIERLHETAAELVACESEAGVLERTLAAAEEVLDLQVCVLVRSREADGTLEVVAATDDPLAPDVGDVVESETNAVKRTYEGGESLLFGDIDEAETASPYHEA